MSNANTRQQGLDFQRVPRVREVAIPEEASIAHCYARIDLGDAYAVAIPDTDVKTPEQLARLVNAWQPAWAGPLLWLRDRMVAVFGVKSAASLHRAHLAHSRPHVGIFGIVGQSENEIVLGENDRHLDFRISVLVRPNTDGDNAAQRELVVSTVVQCHNRLGHTYLTVIAPFHRSIVRKSVQRAARRLWKAAH